jgi:hypothetical protein
LLEDGACCSGVMRFAATERDMPPVERPTTDRREGEQEHLREDGGMVQGPDEEPAERLRVDGGRSQSGEEKGFIETAKDKLTGR